MSIFHWLFVTLPTDNGPLSLLSFTTKRTPFLGRSVMLGHNSSLNPGAGAKLNRWQIVARTRIASVTANACPMQKRGPPPNGK